jgi:hypothetical protein
MLETTIYTQATPRHSMPPKPSARRGVPKIEERTAEEIERDNQQPQESSGFDQAKAVELCAEMSEASNAAAKKLCENAAAAKRVKAEEQILQQEEKERRKKVRSPQPDQTTQFQSKVNQPS